MTENKVRALLVGAGGYGEKIARDILENGEKYGLKLVGVADPAYDSLPLKEAFEQEGIPHFASPEAFYEKETADLAIICSPIPFHEEQVILALRKGSHVLCEKPISPMPEGAVRMQQAAEETGKSVNVGFQLSYIPGILALKKDIASGVLGKPIRLSSLISWPRSSVYFDNPWRGKISWKGMPVMDSILMNACAHYFHLPLFLLGDKEEKSAFPDSMQALVCRGWNIETFDTAMIRAKVKGASVQFLATHIGKQRIHPKMRFEFEKGVVEIREREEEGRILATFRDGTVKDYGAIQPYYYRKIPYCCDVVRGIQKPVCTPRTCAPHLFATCAITQQVPVLSLEKEVVLQDKFAFVEDLDLLMEKAYQEGVMPWELTQRFGTPTEIDVSVWKGNQLL